MCALLYARCTCVNIVYDVNNCLSLTHTQRPENRNSSFTLQFPTNDSNYLFTIEMMCINQHGLSTGVSTSDSFNGSNCVVVEPPTPSPSSSSMPMLVSTTSPTASETPTAPTTEAGKLFRWLARTCVCTQDKCNKDKATSKCEAAVCVSCHLCLGPGEVIGWPPLGGFSLVLY